MFLIISSDQKIGLHLAVSSFTLFRVMKKSLDFEEIGTARNYVLFSVRTASFALTPSTTIRIYYCGYIKC